MRRTLVDAAQTCKRAKRGSGVKKHEMRDDELICKADKEPLALDEVLQLVS